MRALLQLIYPATCIHCKTVAIEQKRLLCEICNQLLQLLDHCPKPAHCTKGAACFEHFGPAASLLYAFKDRLYLDQSLASWMVIQMEKMAFPLPDLIMPFPRTFADKILEGYHRAFLLSQQIGKFYEVPVKDSLNRRQAEFSLKSSINIADKIVLLVVESIDSMELMAKCTHAIQKGFPKALYIIAFSV